MRTVKRIFALLFSLFVGFLFVGLILPRGMTDLVTVPLFLFITWAVNDILKDRIK